MKVFAAAAATQRHDAKPLIANSVFTAAILNLSLPLAWQLFHDVYLSVSQLSAVFV